MKVKNYSVDENKPEQDHFPCGQCGAELLFEPGTDHLKCQYCGHLNLIEVEWSPIREYDFKSALRKLEQLKGKPSKVISILDCPSCGAKFSLKPNEHAGSCPFCSAPAVISSENARYIHPESLLPFIIKEKQAQQIFDDWISTRWFAPSALKDKSKRDDKLTGIYLPYWTYDSDTDTRYQGMRGTVYYDRQVYTAIVNGRPVRQVRNVPRVRWTPVSGEVYLHFDDVLIGATKTLPRTIIDNLHPWDLENLVPYTEAYLSGFRSEIYQVTLDQGFEQARSRMNSIITRRIHQDIGGDQQRISSRNTEHSDTTFKHLLLPVWSAAFKYNKKTYRFVINGRNGQIQGERPYSMVKITLSVLFAIAVFIGIIYFMDDAGMFNGSIIDPYNNSYNNPYNNNNDQFYLPPVYEYGF